MEVTFHTPSMKGYWMDMLIKYTFFLYFITYVQGDCRYELVNSQGILSSPKYPKSYPKDTSCVWTITVGKGYYVELTFLDFDVEPYDDCKTDMLEIKDGGSQNSPLIGILRTRSREIRKKGGQYCNSRPPPKVVTSTGNQLRLWFTSDHTIEKKGFRATYRAVKKEVCGGIVEASSGSITSPRFPLHYPRNTICEWRIKVPEGKFIALEFTYFQIESLCPPNAPCKCNDYVTIKDGSPKAGKEIGKYCFSPPPPLVTSSNEVSIKFYSDSFGRMKGFRALFTQSSTEKCGGDMFFDDGIIQSPNFDLKTDTSYPAFSNCVWTIHAKKNEYLSLQFLYLDVKAQLDKECAVDFVEIRDGQNETSLLLGRFCNRHQPKVLISTGEKIFIKFVSGETAGRKGFQIRYQSHTRSCSSSLGMEDGRITRYNLESSSAFEIAHSPHKLDANLGRLNGPFAWCSQEQKFNFVGEYFQISFDRPTRISKIATQGYTMVGNFYFVTKYKIMYSMTGENFQHYANKVDSELRNLYTEFEGNKQYNISKTNELSPNVVVTSLRIVPLEYRTGRRKHVCLRTEVYGCEIGSGIEPIMAVNGVLEFASKTKSTKIWMLTSEEENAVYLFHLTSKQMNCKYSTLSYSFDGLSYKNEVCSRTSTALQDTKIFPASRQLWLKFEVKGIAPQPQALKVSYSTIVLGRGGLITSFLGKIRLVHNEVAGDKHPSIWLFRFPKGYHLKLDFLNVRLPKGEINPSIVIKSGLEDSSRVVRKIEGREGHWAFMHPKNILRIEYWSGRGMGDMLIKGLYDDGFTLQYAVVKA